MVNFTLSRVKSLLWCLGMLLTTTAFGQDTLTVQTFTWESDTRNDVFQFPEDDGTSYAKILMTYNMRCHDNEVGNGNVGCREWDYSCNTFITDSSMTDSLMRMHPSHLISNSNEKTFPYRSEPAYYYTKYDRIRTRGGVLTDLDTFEVYPSDMDVDGWQEDQIRYQCVLLADELTMAGMTAGKIQGMELPFDLGDFMSMSFRVKLAQTDITSLSPDQFFQGPLQEVFFDELQINNPGMNQLLFKEAFEWDGTSNVLVELSYNDKMTPTPEKLKGWAVSNRAIIANDEDHVFMLNGAQYIDVASTDIDEVDDQITVMAWVYGMPESLPDNTYFIEGVDEDGRRQFNVHLPWGDGNVYFDAGNDGGGYDRISKAAQESEYEGQWNHWAFTKDATTGSMKIYLNGQLWHSGNGKAKSMSLEKMYIGKGVNSNNAHNSLINEVSIWKKALDQSEIQEAMLYRVDDQFTSYDDLLVYLQFEEMRGSEVRNAQNNQYYEVVGSPSWISLRGEELYHNFRSADEIPAFTLMQGEVERINDVNSYLDSMMAPKHWVRSFEVQGSDLVELASQTYWRGGYYPVKNSTGDIIDSVLFAPEGMIDITDLTYYDKTPAKFEILSLVTPYGNGLSLGAEGKTFTFDVTDFAPLLKGQKRMSVEMGGQWQEELDIKFHFIEGTPPREVKSIQNLWRFDRGGYAAIQEDRIFEPRMVEIPSEAQEFKIRSSITGHGQNGEFQPRDHYVDVNGGEQDFVFRVWKECSTIPIYPQGGTWPFDRAGWCPGDPTLLFEHDITDMVTPGQMTAVDYGVNGPTMDQANYLVSQQLVSYGPKNFANNASLEAIVRPSTSVEWERENPSCNRPTVMIKNNGSERLQFVTIEYGLKNGVKEMFMWAGNLDFGQTEMVELPIRSDDFWKLAVDGTTDIFEAEILEVNRTDDEYPADNKMTSKVNAADMMTGELQFEFRTNTRGGETSFEILDDMGEVVYSGSGYGENEKVVIDLDLSPGCYSLNFNDSGDDGLYYWFWEQTGQNRGRGYLQFNKLIRGRPIKFKGFEAEFGRYIHYDFVIDGLVSSKDQRVLRHLNVFPNPNDGRFVVDFYSERSAELQVQVMDLTGRMIVSDAFQTGTDQQLRADIDLGNAIPGMYLVKCTQEDRTTTRRIMVR